MFLATDKQTDVVRIHWLFIHCTASHSFSASHNVAWASRNMIAALAAQVFTKLTGNILSFSYDPFIVTVPAGAE